MRVSSAVYETDEPVDADRARSLAINEVLREPLSEHLDTQRTRLRYALGGGALGVVAGVVAFFVANAAVSAALIVLGLLIGGGGYAYVTSRSPDVTVTSVTESYWESRSLPVQDGTIVYDVSASLSPTAFELERLSSEETIADASDRLDELDEFPVVLPRDDNVEAEVTETLESIKSEIDAAEQHTVEAPIIAADSPEAAAVSELATLADADDHADVEPSIDPEEARADVEDLDELERMAAVTDEEAELERISETTRTLVNDLSGMQETAIDLLNGHVATAADAFGLVSYNFYCPDCQTDGIDSSVELADPQEGTWYCDTCRDHYPTETVIPRHKIKDDIVNPVWDQLWIEKDDERRGVYENIEDQKSDLQEREFEQRREEIRSVADRIRDLRSRIRDLKTEAKAAEGKVTEISSLMVKYERLDEGRKRDFEREVEASFAEIDEETERILEQTRNEEQARIEAAEQDAKEKAQMMREDERRREIEKFTARQEMENKRKRAELQQRAELHGEEIDMEKRHHREEWMLETRGRTSFSGRIDRFKLWKDRKIGQSAYEGGDD
ncbi:MAG: hypothetical protein RI568_08555 [Natronomonas sp.]|uniref:hypothetical protein n=1 Tax=Natronomonas sp. TaxID=2184060 RepID=UPI0028703428|nr:hypothetical protein [Natronomonas sp.]MDR9430731.1 hypothetical protein [Natronomonas sp.]